MAQLEKDRLFERFLDQELSGETDHEAAFNIRRAARIAFYGVHYQRLFAEGSPSAAEHDIAPRMRRMMKLTMPIADMVQGENLYEHFVSQHPGHEKVYLA